MKRSPLKRKTPLAQGAPLKRTPMRRTSPKRRQATAANDERFRSPEYLAWVRTLPCCVCGAVGGVAAHHVTGMWQLSGMALKPGDNFVMPACDPIYGHDRDCHQQIHADKVLRDRQPGFIRDTISRGVRRFDGGIKEALIRAWKFIDEKEAA